MNEKVTVRWLGHSCFRLTWRDRSLITDPYEDGYVPGLPPLREEADAVFCSHGHGDHNAASLVKLSGLGMPDGFSVDALSCPHDHHDGKRRVMNVIHIFSFDGLRVVDMGDVGTMALEKGMLDALRGCDLLLIPVGGYYTIDANEAATLSREIAPRVLVPMHYRGTDPKFGFDVLSTLEPLLTHFPKEDVLYTDGPAFELTGDSPKGLVIPGFPF